MAKKQKTSKRKQESGDTKHHFSSNYVGIILVGIVIIWAVLNQLYINNLINHGPTQVVKGTIDSKCRVNYHSMAIIHLHYEKSRNENIRNMEDPFFREWIVSENK